MIRTDTKGRMYNDTLESRLMCYIMLPRNLKLRRKIIHKISKIYQNKYKNDGILKSKRRTKQSKIKYGKTIDKYENFEDME